MRPALLAALVCTMGTVPTPRAELPEVVANDNRTPAGTLKDGVLTLDLVIVMARWHPEAADGPFADLPVFAEEGQAPRIPGPLVRVPQGTRVRLTVRNALADSPVGLWGHGITHDDTSTVPIAPGARRTFEYTATEAGTFLYGGRASTASVFEAETEQLGGAIVVDAPGARTDDRIIVLNIYGALQRDSSYANALAMNGRSWPHTERIEAVQGDTLRWRVVNATARDHPMHLHGAYFRVDARGDAVRDSVFAPSERPMEVTEQMKPRGTMLMTWSPETPGNWLFHCHLAFHVVALARLGTPPDGGHELHSTDPDKHMAGLVMGIHVRARGEEAARRGVRRLAVTVAPGIARDTVHPAPIGFRLTPDGRVPAPARVTSRGDLILLTRGEPTDVTVHNALAEPTAIHWHGLELESYSDGVAGFGVTAGRVAPAIAPRDSFVARLTLKRAGTFIYHTHLNDLDQITAGLYGPLVVLEPGQRWDPSRDLVLTAGFDLTQADPSPVINGGESDAPLELRVGARVRIRMINIQPADQMTFEIVRDSTVMQWRPVAKDGFELPASQSAAGPATRTLWVGETFDAAFTPTEPGLYQLRARQGPAVLYDRALMVRRAR